MEATPKAIAILGQEAGNWVKIRGVFADFSADKVREKRISEAEGDVSSFLAEKVTTDGGGRFSLARNGDGGLMNGSEDVVTFTAVDLIVIHGVEATNLEGKVNLDATPNGRDTKAT